MHTIISKDEKLNGSKLKVFLRRLLYTIQNKLIGIASDTIIVHAQFFKDILIKDYKVKGSRIKVIPQGIMEDIPKYDKEGLKKLLRLEGPIYLIIGSFVPDHGADVIIKQADKIGKTILIVANSKAVNDRNLERITNWVNYNNEIIENNNFKEYIKFHTGDINYEWWWKYFTIADLILLPYKGGIGSGIFSDAIATKTPMVCSNIKFFREHSNNKFLRIAEKDEDFPNEIKEAIKNKDLMLKSFDNYISKYGLSRVAKKYIKLYEK
jgi:hypothetical protein